MISAPPRLVLGTCAVLLAAAARATGTGVAAESIPPDTTIADIMAKIVMPTADVVWGSTADYIIEHDGDDGSPQADAEWQAMEDARIRLREALGAVRATDRPA